MLTNEWINGIENADGIFSMRKDIFSCPPDVYDRYAMQLAVYDGDKLAASGRLYVDDRGRFSISHVCVKEGFRNGGLGDLAVKLLLFRGFGFAERIYAVIPEEMFGWLCRYGFKKEENTEGESIAISVKKDECVYPSKCGVPEKA